MIFKNNFYVQILSFNISSYDTYICKTNNLLPTMICVSDTNHSLRGAHYYNIDVRRKKTTKIKVFFDYKYYFKFYFSSSLFIYLPTHIHNTYTRKDTSARSIFVHNSIIFKALQRRSKYNNNKK